MTATSYFRQAKAHFIASHQHPVNIALHHLSNILAIAAVPLLFVDWRLAALLVFLTQVFTLGGHAFFEKNEPAFIRFNSGVMILASLSWSFENWFGLRQQGPKISRARAARQQHN